MYFKANFAIANIKCGAKFIFEMLTKKKHKLAYSIRCINWKHLPNKRNSVVTQVTTTSISIPILHQFLLERLFCFLEYIGCLQNCIPPYYIVGEKLYERYRDKYVCIHSTHKRFGKNCLCM